MRCSAGGKLLMGWVVTLLLLPATASATGLRSTFNSGAQGWSAPVGTLDYHDQGGHPGGDISVDETMGLGDLPEFLAPDEWTGDHRDTYGGSISFDMKFGPNVNGHSVEVDLRSGFLAINHVVSVGELPSWKHFKIPLKPGPGWSTTDPGIFKEALSSLDSVRVFAHASNPGDTVNLDNAVLASSVKRKLSISYARGRFSGRLKPKGSCAKKRLVGVYRERPGRDSKIGSHKTTSRGKYAVAKRNAAKGSYYATVKSSFASGVGNCKAAKSKKTHVH